MKLVRMEGINRLVRLAERSDARGIVEKSMRENKKFYRRLAQM